MNWWIWYCGAGLLVYALVVAWDWYASVYAATYGTASDRLMLLVTAIVIVPVWPIVLVVQVKDMAKHIANPPQRYVKFKFKSRHLIRKIGIQEAEECECIFDPLGAVPDLPFGFLNGTWRNFLTQLTPVDSLWVLSARDMNGFQMEEREGYAIVRFGWIRRTMLTSRIEIGEEK
jgi:hypothetical protein